MPPNLPSTPLEVRSVNGTADAFGVLLLTGSKREIKGVLQKYGVYPSKKLGQNFLVDKAAIRKFLKAADLSPKGIVLEIGPGIGNLTRELAKKVKMVIAVEKDPKMCEILKDLLKGWNVRNVKIVQDDVLKIPHSTFNIPHSYKAIGNLPFYLTSPVIRRFLESENPPEQMVLFVQKEVAQRICSRPPKMNFLAVLVQFYTKPEIIDYVSKKSFWPQPKVDSAILRITQICTDKKTDKHRFFEIVRAGFSQPRKQVLNNLSKELKLNKEEVKSWLLKNNVLPEQRAEVLTIEDWEKLTKSFETIK